MSKIYEALLRAELERAAGAGEPVAEKRVIPTLQQNDAYQSVASVDILRENSQYFDDNFAPLPSVPVEHEIPSLASLTPRFTEIKEMPWHPSPVQLKALEDRGSVVEQFRSLRSRIQGFRKTAPLKTILISSGHPQEGKSFVSANLAISFARHKSDKVLLIDGDMRRSSLHRLLGCPSEPGLTEYLSGTASPFEIMQRAQPNADGTPLPKGLASLTLIPGGADAGNASELSGSAKFAELLQIVSPMFDWIVIDSSPVNLVLDGVNLARSADGVLLVVRGGVTKLETAQRAMSELKGAKMLGVVLNAVDGADDPENGYYGYDAVDA